MEADCMGGVALSSMSPPAWPLQPNPVSFFVATTSEVRCQVRDLAASASNVSRFRDYQITASHPSEHAFVCWDGSLGRFHAPWLRRVKPLDTIFARYQQRLLLAWRYAASTTSCFWHGESAMRQRFSFRTSSALPASQSLDLYNLPECRSLMPLPVI